MNELRFIGTVTDGVLKLTNQKGFKEDLRGFEGQRVILTLKKYRKSRTDRQNRFYWGNFIESEIECFKERWGETYSKQEIHDWNKSMFWAEEAVDEDTGEVFKKPASSADKTTVEFEERLESGRQWFRQKMDWEIGYPGEQSEIDI